MPIRSSRLVDRVFPQPDRLLRGIDSVSPRLLEIPYPPLISVDAVKYVDGTTRTGTFAGDTGVNTSTETITLSAAATWLLTGVRVTYDNGGNSSVGGLTDDSDYYVATSDSTSFTLHESAYDARLGQNAVDLTATSSGNHTISSIEQLIAATNYCVVLSEDANGYLEFDDDYDFPDLADRPDAVRYEWTSGYTTRASIRPQIVTAVLFKTQELVDGDDKAGKTAEQLIMNAWGGRYV